MGPGRFSSLDEPIQIIMLYNEENYFALLRREIDDAYYHYLHAKPERDEIHR
jgi:hypothetical protein